MRCRCLVGVFLLAAAAAAAQTPPTIDQILSLKRAGAPAIYPDGR